MIGGQFGFKTETTYGTAVTVDQFHEGYLSDNPTRRQEPIPARGQRAGRRTATLMKAGAKTVRGTYRFELMPSPMATLLRHMTGTIATTGAGPTYTHTASPGSTDDDIGFTSQVVIPDTSGTDRTFTFSGCRIMRWNISARAGELAMFDLDTIAQDYVTNVSKASASYGTDVPFCFVEGQVQVDGNTLAEVTSFEMDCTIPRRVKHPIGSSTIMAPIENGRREVMIRVDTDFEDLTLHDLANTEVATVLTFDNGSDSLTITTNTFVVPSTPSNPDIDSDATETYEGRILGTSDSNALQMVLINTESTSA